MVFMPFLTKINPAMSSELLTTNRKALTINLDEAKYGTFAEIGAGQEVARHFFQAGGAAGTVAKSISAYDMKFSDAIYGKSARYVSRERLGLMLEHEYELLLERLKAVRGDNSAFFVFANTVAARNFKGTNECHGWMGIRFQAEPNAPPCDIVMHVRMWDKENVLQQQALGLIGVNLIYGAFYYLTDQDKFIQSLADNLTLDRIEVDMINFTGPQFVNVDNRLMSLKLVEYGLTNAVMFNADGVVMQPVTLVNDDMLKCSLAQFLQEPAVLGRDVIVLMELTIHNLSASGNIDHEDFLARVDTLAAIGYNVLISNYFEFFRLTSYFRRFTKEMVGVVMGINNLLEIFNEKYYDSLEGGILESVGRLFKASTKLYVYPMRKSAYDRYCLKADCPAPAPGTPALPADVWINATNLQVALNLRNLYAHLMENRYISPIVGFDPSIMDIFSRDVLAKIQNGESGWENGVPPKVAALIKERQLFGCRTPSARELHPV
jgi:hypothetical protein